ncbi:hypothetical protein M885DRAFT_542616 [Pelagophyceae sp. CCMP2097]|nr:hypothetical protein M885DRAFT_542616 [Pelagophyceae sp. CCMP2097]
MSSSVGAKAPGSPGATEPARKRTFGLGRFLGGRKAPPLAVPAVAAARDAAPAAAQAASPASDAGHATDDFFARPSPAARSSSALSSDGADFLAGVFDDEPEPPPASFFSRAPQQHARPPPQHDAAPPADGAAAARGDGARRTPRATAAAAAWQAPPPAAAAPVAAAAPPAEPAPSTVPGAEAVLFKLAQLIGLSTEKRLGSSSKPPAVNYAKMFRLLDVDAHERIQRRDWATGLRQILGLSSSDVSDGELLTLHDVLAAGAGCATLAELASFAKAAQDDDALDRYAAAPARADGAEVAQRDAARGRHTDFSNDGDWRHAGDEPRESSPRKPSAAAARARDEAARAVQARDAAARARDKDAVQLCLWRLTLHAHEADPAEAGAEAPSLAAFFRRRRFDASHRISRPHWVRDIRGAFGLDADDEAPDCAEEALLLLFDELAREAAGDTADTADCSVSFCELAAFARGAAASTRARGLEHARAELLAEEEAREDAQQRRIAARARGITSASDDEEDEAPGAAASRGVDDDAKRRAAAVRDAFRFLGAGPVSTGVVSAPTSPGPVRKVAAAASSPKAAAPAAVVAPPSPVAVAGRLAPAFSRFGVKRTLFNRSASAVPQPTAAPAAAPVVSADVPAGVASPPRKQTPAGRKAHSLPPPKTPTIAKTATIAAGAAAAAGVTIFFGEGSSVGDGSPVPEVRPEDRSPATSPPAASPVFPHHFDDSFESSVVRHSCLTVPLEDDEDDDSDGGAPSGDESPRGAPSNVAVQRDSSDVEDDSSDGCGAPAPEFSPRGAPASWASRGRAASVGSGCYVPAPRPAPPFETPQRRRSDSVDAGLPGLGDGTPLFRLLDKMRLEMPQSPKPCSEPGRSLAHLESLGPARDEWGSDGDLAAMEAAMEAAQLQCARLTNTAIDAARLRSPSHDGSKEAIHRWQRAQDPAETPADAAPASEAPRVIAPLALAPAVERDEDPVIVIVSPLLRLVNSPPPPRPRSIASPLPLPRTVVAAVAPREAAAAAAVAPREAAAAAAVAPREATAAAAVASLPPPRAAAVAPREAAAAAVARLRLAAITPGPVMAAYEAALSPLGSTSSLEIDFAHREAPPLPEDAWPLRRPGGGDVADGVVVGAWMDALEELTIAATPRSLAASPGSEARSPDSARSDGFVVFTQSAKKLAASMDVRGRFQPQARAPAWGAAPAARRLRPDVDEVDMDLVDLPRPPSVSSSLSSGETSWFDDGVGADDGDADDSAADAPSPFADALSLMLEEDAAPTAWAFAVSDAAADDLYDAEDDPDRALDLALHAPPPAAA